MIMKRRTCNDGNEAYQKAKKFMKELMPKNVKNIKKYRGKTPFSWSKYWKRANNIFEPTVKLKSGGYLVINPTGTSCNRYKFGTIYETNKYWKNCIKHKSWGGRGRTTN